MSSSLAVKHHYGRAMPGSISDITQFGENRGLRWSHDMQLVELLFDSPVKAVLLRRGTGILVVEPAGGHAPDTAIILNPDGTLRARVKNPEGINGAICFGDAYYVEDELTLIICFSSWQMACVINEVGEVLRTYETR